MIKFKIKKGFKIKKTVELPRPPPVPLCPIPTVGSPHSNSRFSKTAIPKLRLDTSDR